MELKRTARGFGLYEFADLYGENCSLQKSSLATDDAIWLGICDANPQIMVSDARKLGLTTSHANGWMAYPVPDQVLMSTRMHLNRQQVSALVPILQRFVETGELYDVDA